MKLILSTFVLFSVLNAFSQQINYDWGFGLTSNEDVRCSGLTHDNSGNIYVTGTYRSSVDFDPSNGVLISVPTNATDAFITKFSPAGDLIWARFLPSTNGHVTPKKILSDNSGNIYLAGEYSGTQNFAIGNGPSDVRTEILGNDIFIIKITTDGNSIWSKSYGTQGTDNIIDITSDEEDNLVFTGIISYASGEYDADTTGFIASSTASDIVVTKLNSSGITQWLRTFGSGNGTDYGTCIVTDLNNNVFVAGVFSNIISFPSLSISATSEGGSDIVLLKISSTGELLMVKDYGGPNQDSALDIDVDNLGNIYTIGQYIHSIDIDPSYLTDNLNSFSNGNFIQKLDVNGDFQWANDIGNPYGSFFGHLKIDNFGYPIFSFNFSGSISYGSGLSTSNSNGTDVLVAKLDPSGNALWVINTGSDIVGSSVYPSGLSIDLNNTIAFCGSFNEEIDLDPTSGVDNFVAITGLTANDHNGFCIKISDASSELNEYSSFNNFDIFPNPTNDGVVSIKGTNNGSAQLFSSDMKEILRIDLIEEMTTINIPDESGVYFIQITSEKKTETHKVVKI